MSMLSYVSLVYSTVHHSFGFIAGFGDRLLAEMKKLTPKDNKIRVSQLPSHDTPCILSFVLLDICSSRQIILNMDGVSSLRYLLQRQFICLSVIVVT